MCGDEIEFGVTFIITRYIEVKPELPTVQNIFAKICCAIIMGPKIQSLGLDKINGEKEVK